MKFDRMRGIQIEEIEGIEFDDYPDFCDAYAVSAYWEDTGEELTDEELEILNDDHNDLVHEATYDKIY